MYPALRRFAIELWRLYATAEELEAAYGYRYYCEDASYGKSEVEREKAPYGAKNRARYETGKHRRERVNDRLADPTSARLVPMHVGTRDPVDRVRASRKRLLGERRCGRGENEQGEDPARPLGAARVRPDEDTEPNGGKKRPRERRLRQHTLPTYPRHMQRLPNALIQSQHR
jgi:hypothetical protein